MVASDPRDALVLAHERVHRLRADSASRRLSGVPAPRRALAAALRHAAERLDPVPLAPRPA
jgi:hypothetical protein